jgi:hypothetical protein
LVDPALITPLERYHDDHEKMEGRAYKLLGVYLDEYLSLNYHVNYLTRKLAKSMYCLIRAKDYLTKPALKSIYYSFIHSHLSYCPTILNCTNNNNINSLFKIQKKAIRIISKSNYNDHTGPLFKELRILPYALIIKQSKLKIMHAIHFEYAPKSFTNIWTKNANRNININLRNNALYQLPFVRIEIFRKTPLYTLPAEWNVLGDLTLISDKLPFLVALKLQLIE